MTVSAPRSRWLPLLLVSSLLVGAGVSCLPSVDGYGHPAWMWGRQMEWLLHATETPISPASLSNVTAHLERDRRDANFSLPAGAIPDGSWDGTFDKLWRLRDTSDFDALRIIDLLYGYRGHPAASEATWAAAEQALFDFKYWYTDPTPARVVDGEPVVDNMWYWTENHVLMFKVVEYLVGQRYPNQVFSVTGQTGAWHRDRARGFIRDWLRERAQVGFTEWHSNVYYNSDIRPLLVFVEWAEEPELVRRASMVLDLLFLDIALHLHEGTFGATHGRSYIKNKASATTEGTFEPAKFMFEDTAFPWEARNGSTAAVLAHARRYRIPEVIRRIATDDAPMVDRERMNLPLEEELPAVAPTCAPGAPLGWDWCDVEYLPYWWGTNAFTTWTHVGLTLQEGFAYDLFDSQFADFADLVTVVWNPDNFDQSVQNAYLLLRGLWPAANFALLKEVNTYTYRTPAYMLSTAQDYRKGLRSSQTHVWQATLDEQAMVFVTHPTYRPEDIQAPPYDGWSWSKRDESGAGSTGGRWTGDGALPRSAQFENVNVSIYQPAYAPLPQLDFVYEDETHAYFPVAHFDEVVRDGHWTYGKRGDGYVALYSRNPVDWRSDQPEVFQNGGLDFDLVAEGSASNVWIVELGSLDEWPGGFEAFQAAFDESLVHFPDVGEGPLEVVYDSPSQGTVSFGWEADLVVDGAAQPIADYARYDNPFVRTDFLDTRYEVSDGEYSLVLDFTDLEDESQDLREATAPDRAREQARALIEAVWNEIWSWWQTHSAGV
ncbi:MAG: hypothetical protein ACQGVK_10810 [Myxococcota bacterium]